MSKPSWSAVAVFSCCAYFFLAGVLWVDDLGIHSDEALFSGGLYEPILPEYSMSVFKNRIPLMVMTYVGTLKSLIYAPILAIWAPSAASARIPVLVIGMVTVGLFYRFLHRTCGRRAALVGCALLATDPIFLLTTKWDWGPVAVHHLCLVGGALLLVSWYQERRSALLAAAFFVFGLGLWNKAIFIWPMMGLLAGGMAAFPKTIVSVLRRQNIAIATVALLIGALPLVIYNLRRNFQTFRANATWSADAMPNKIRLVRDTLEGSALIGWIVRPGSDGPVSRPQSWIEKACVGLSAAFGSPTRSWMAYAFTASLLLSPFIWRQASKPILFSSCFLVVTWLQMALTKGAGTGPHHSILLWPVPVLLVAVVFATASYKWRHGAAALATVTCFLLWSNVLVTSSYYSNQIRHGAPAAWTDAIYPLSDALERLNVRHVNLVDFVFFDTIRFLHQGRITLGFAAEPTNEAQRAFARTQCSDPDALFIGLTQSAGTQKFLDFALHEGLQRHSIALFADRNGRQVLELFRFNKSK